VRLPLPTTPHSKTRPLNPNQTRYATEIDVDFVRKSVRAIGKLAIKIEPAARLCVNTLLDLVSTKVSYIVQEATVVFRNIFRKYPNQYESIISTLCENLDSLDEPEAKAAMIWVIGQYADRIDNADELLDDFLFTFMDESLDVQLALLTATVKLFIQRPSKGQALVPKVLKWATEETDNPDLRDRGFMYWRLLSSDLQTQDPNTTRRIVMGAKPAITTESEKLDPVTLEEMCLVVGTLATVYLKPVSQVFRSARPRRLMDSPALQRDQLPTTQAAIERRKSLHVSTMLGAAGSEQETVNGSAKAGDLNAALDAADDYFANIGAQQMAQMTVQDGGQFASPVQGPGGTTVGGQQGMYQNLGAVAGANGQDNLNGGDLLIGL
jgi:AP-2 complex subunit beta-1